MPYHYAIIFGRTPALSRLELEAIAPRFGLRVGRMLDAEIALADCDEALAPEELNRLQQTLGGTVQIAELMTQVNRESLVESAAELVLTNTTADAKTTVGISIWSGNGKLVQATRVAKPLKTALQAAGRSVRVVTPPEPHTHLSAAQIIHNKLINSDRALDLVCIATRGEWWLGITRAVQDIADYTNRDFGIPRPDPISGMLPPKLAQTLVNIAVGANRNLAIYDPFCGNGRVLLEASLLGLEVYGSDLRKEQVEATLENLAWQSQEYNVPYVTPDRVWQADATAGPGRRIGHKFVIVAEPYLGKPLRVRLAAAEQEAWLADLVPLYRGFFDYWHQSPEQPEEMIVIFPRTTTVDNQEVAVYDAIVDRLHQVGYSAEVLFCYDRPDSIIRRDVVRLKQSQRK